MRRLTALLSACALLAPAAAAPAAPNGITSYGAGLGGANTGHLWCNQTPSLGAALAFEMDSFTNGPVSPGYGALVVCATEVVAPLFGGTLLVDPNTFLFANVVFYDIYAVSLVGVPNDASLVGQSFYTQVGLNFPQSVGWRLSNGLQVTVCP